MEDLVLELVSHRWERQLEAYKQAYLLAEGADFVHGASGLVEASSVGAWIDTIENYKDEATCPPDRVRAYTYLSIHPRSQQIVGILNLRLALNDYLRDYGGHIGYSIHPDFRGKGYGKKQLALLLEEARTFDLERLLITCNQDNQASAATIIRNGGQYEKTVFNPHDQEYVKHFWMDL